MKPTLKDSRLVVNFHCPKECACRALAWVRLINRRCQHRQLTLLTIDPTRHYTHISVQVSMRTHEPHQLQDLLSAIYTLTSRCDMNISDVNLLLK